MCTSSMTLPVLVFPAHAGMSLSDSDFRESRACFPRSRGDEPASEVEALARKKFSPLTRG